MCPLNAGCTDSQCYCNNGYTWSQASKACIEATSPSGAETRAGNQQPEWTCNDTALTVCQVGKDHLCFSLTENEHCGSCDNTCAVNEQCFNGQCIPVTPDTSSIVTTISTTPVSSGIQTCSVNSDCKVTTAGKAILTSKHEVMTCQNGQCLPACNTGWTNCAANGNIACHDTSSDPNNCGRCGNVCTSGSCSYGICQQPKPIVTMNPKIVVQQIQPSWSGSWTGYITYSFDMSFTLDSSGKSVTGSYAGGQGSLSGTLSTDGKTINGQARWKGGTPMTFQFVMATDGQSFTGYYQDSSGSHPWTGHR